MSEKIKVTSFNLRIAVKGDGVNYFDNRLPRIVEFMNREKPDIIGFQEVNTHLDHKGKLARVFGAMQILQFVSSKAEPCVITGDFNASPDSPEIKLLVENQEYSIVEATARINHTFHDFSPNLRGKIDYIFTSLKCDPDEAICYEDEPVDGVYLSDHIPVTAFIEIE